MTRNRKDRLVRILVPVGLLVIMAAFLTPFLLGWKPMFFDDIAFFYYPHCLFLARTFQQGIIPFWDPHVSAGGALFFARLFVCTYNLVLMPFLWLTRLGDNQQSLLMIFKLPVLLYYLLATFWTFALARRGLRLNRAGSAVMTLCYIFSPMMIYYVTYPPCIFVYSMLPALLLFSILFGRSGRPGYLALGAIIFAVFSPSGESLMVMQVSTLAVLLSLFSGLGFALRRKYAMAFRLIVGIILIIVIGVLLAGIYWGNIGTALELHRAKPMLEEEVALGRGNSFPPAFLATLLVPDWFGTVTCAHTWGAPYQVKFSINDAQMTGGVALIFVGLLGFIASRGRARRTEAALWIKIFAALVLFGVLVTLGRYTPFYRVLEIIPVFKWLPYPLRWRVIECFAMSGLAGSSISLIWDRRRIIARAWSRRLTDWFLLGSLAVLIIASLWPVSAQGERYVPGIRHLMALEDQKWFFSGPFLYFLIAGITLLIFARIRSTLRVYLLTALIAGELLWFAVPAFYRNRILNYRCEDLSAERFYGPNDHPLYSLSRGLNHPEFLPGDIYRWAFFRSSLDHVAWINRSLSILGFGIRPLVPRFHEAIDGFAPGLPYELWPKRWETWLWRNMSVRYIFQREILRLPNILFKANLGSFYIYELVGALPRFYFQDRWAVGDEEKQLLALRDYDLRASGYCAEEVWDKTRLAEELPEAEPLSEEEWIRHYNSLQDSNRIVSRDLSNPNRVVLEVDVDEPSVLVMTDVWHPDWKITVDGKGESLYRVNYLQRGVWCPPGKYKIIMEFLPSTLKRGFTMTALGLAGLAWLMLASIRRTSRSSLS